jgi:hypothetical protein
LYIFTFCSILTKRTSEKYTTNIKFIYYTNCTYLFGPILVFGSLCYTKTCFSLVLRVIFPEWLTSGQLYYSDVMILFDVFIIFELFLKLPILVFGSLLFLSSAHLMKQEISKGRNYFCFNYDKTDDSYQH